jgi:multidrug efflux pump subunit AcrB
MGGLLSYFVRHRTAANLALALMLLSGLYAALTMRAQFFPDIVIERVTVTVAWTGAGPEEVDAQIVAVLDPVLLAVEGVESSAAAAREGAATISLEFEPGWDMGRAVDDVSAAVDRIDNLPDTAETPRVRRIAYRDRVTDVMLWGPAPAEQLARYAVEFQSRLFAAGVARTTLDGAPDPVIRVSVPEAALVRHDLSIEAIAAAARDAATAMPAGDVGPGGARVRAGVERRSAEAIGDVILRREADGAPLRIRDVAAVTVEGAENGEAYFVGDDPAVRLRVDRSDQGDAIAIQRAVEAEAAAFAATLPEGVEIQLTRTRAQQISDRLGILVSNGALGLGLVLLFLFLFLSARTAFWVAFGIPAAMAASLGLMHAFGISLNMMSLFALIICLGVVVDDAIVVGEHADMLARRGAGPAEAAERAATRMFGPVFAASVTTIMAFLAIAVVGGRFGALILDIPLTVAMVMLASLLESFIILPAHMRHALSAKRAAPWYDWPSRQVDRGLRRVRERAFKPLIRLVIRGRYLAVGAVAALLLHSLTLFATGEAQWRFFNAPERGAVTANFAMAPDATRDDTLAMLREMQRALSETDAAFAAEHGRAPVTFALGVVGGTLGRGLSSDDSRDEDQIGGVTVEMIDPDDRPYGQRDFMRRWEATVRRHPKLDTLSMRGLRSGPEADDIAVELSGAEPHSLKAAAEALKAALAALPAVAGAEDSLPYDKEELELTVTPFGEALGFTADAVGRELRARLSGIEAAEFPLGPRTATVEVSAPEAELAADYLGRAMIRAPSGAWAELSEVVEARRSFGFAAIRRADGLPVVTVSAEFATEAPEAQAAAVEALETAILPDLAARHGVRWSLSGLAEQERDFLSDAALGFALCVAGIYLTLAWIFASWTRPLVVVLTIPLGLIGVIWGHYWMATPLSMFSVVGLLGLSGIIINDAIVLVTTVDAYARRRALAPALVDAAGDRLRAVFLTTATTVAGLAPLLFERSTQAQFLKPTVITLAYGLGFGMLLVLIVVPALVMIQDDVGRAAASARRLLRLWASGRRYGRAAASRRGRRAG